MIKDDREKEREKKKEKANYGMNEKYVEYVQKKTVETFINNEISNNEIKKKWFVKDNNR